MELAEFFHQVPDPRRAQRQRFPLSALLWMAFVAIASGYQRLRKMAPLGRSKAALFTAYFGLRHGLPSYGAFRDLLQALDKDARAQAFGRWFIPQAQAGDWVAGDGQSPLSTVQGAQQASQPALRIRGEPMLPAHGPHVSRAGRHGPKNGHRRRDQRQRLRAASQRQPA